MIVKSWQYLKFEALISTIWSGYRFYILSAKMYLLPQVKIAGENIFGTSQPRTVFTFATKGAGEK